MKFTFYNRPIPAAVVIGLIMFAYGVSASQVSLAQRPDPLGWSNQTTNSRHESLPAMANRPGAIAPLSDPQTAPFPDIPDASIRQQIGLASGEETVETNTATSDSEPPTEMLSLSDLFSGGLDQLTSPTGLMSSIKVALLVATLSLAPAIVLMTTCYVRVIVVLTLLKQAFGAQQLPPTQVLTALSLFVTLLVMTPVWSQIKSDAIDPYTRSENPIGWEEAWNRGVVPVKKFMARQIEVSNNGNSIALLYKYQPNPSLTPPASAEEVPLNVLLPAFLISELKVAFLLGFQIYMPFLVLDLVVSSVTVSSGMLMLPPTMVSFPLKLILFVLVDGWNLVVGMLLQSFAPFT